MKLSNDDLVFCSKARYKSEIADYLGISVKTLSSWLMDIKNVYKEGRKLFKPNEVKEILEQCK